MSVAIIYSNESQECERAIALMENLNQPYILYVSGQDFDPSQFSKEFGDHAEYPQIALGYEHIGSLKETLNYFKDKNFL